MPSPETTATLRRNLRAITADGVCFSLNVGTGERYITAFTLAAGSGDVLGGLVTAVPALGGAILQFVTPWLVPKIRSLRRWVVLTATLQAFSFIPLILAAVLGWAPIWLIYLAAVTYWAGGMSCGAAWTTWVGGLIPDGIRNTFLARRNLLCHASVFLGVLTSGLILRYSGEEGRLQAFAIVFALGLVARFASSRFLASQSEGPVDATTHRRVSILDLLRRVRHRADGRLIAYVVIFQMAARMAEPYYDTYALSSLHFSYDRYMLLLGAFFVAKAVVSPTLGRIAFRGGTHRLLWIGALLLAPLPVLWILSARWEYLAVVQLVNGVAWSAHELAVILLFFEAIREEERTSLVTTYNLLNAFAISVGGLLGGAILHALGDSRTAYHWLFAASFAARTAAVLLLLRTPRPPAQGNRKIE